MTSTLPGSGITNRPLHFIWLCDCSASMRDGGKIQALNNAIRQAIPLMQDAANDNPNAQVLVRAVTFSSGAQWHISQPTPVEQFYWDDLYADGVTDMGQALSLVAEQLKMPPMTDRALPPVLVLISDGYPTDDINSGLRKLMELPWGKKAVRISIAIGDDADYDVLQKFIGHSELPPLQANNPDQLVEQIKWVSTVVVQADASPPSQSEGSFNTNMNVPIPTPPTVMDSDVADVW